jgi:hypothetical protein
MSNGIIILVIVILLGSILYWKRYDLFGTGEDDVGSDDGGAEAEAEAAAALAALAALGESCSKQDCVSPLVCDEYSMKCAHPPFGDSLINYTSLSQASRDSIGSGWTQIKYLPGTSTTWFPGDETWEYAGTEFLFTRGDFSAWLICDKFQAVGEFYDGTPRTITKSSISATPYTAVWFNRHYFLGTVWLRGMTTIDPVISLEDFHTSETTGTIMYIEDSHTAAANSIHSSGMYVFIR